MMVSNEKIKRHTCTCPEKIDHETSTCNLARKKISIEENTKTTVTN